MTDSERKEAEDKVLAKFLERQEVTLCMFIAKLNSIKEQLQEIQE